MAQNLTQLGYGMAVPPGMAALLNSSEVSVKVGEAEEFRPDKITARTTSLTSLSSEWVFCQVNNISPLSCLKGKVLIVPSTKFMKLMRVQ